MRLPKRVITGTCTVVLLFALYAIASAQVITKPRVAPSPPDLPSYTGFVRFNDGKQIFLQVRRTAYNRLEFQSPGSSEWQTVTFDQFPHGERQRLKRLLMVEEELSPPKRTGVRVTLKRGETIEGFMKEDDPEEWPGESDENTTDGSDESGGTTPSISEGNQTDDRFVLLTRNGEQRRLSYDAVVEKELIQVNPLQMVGAEQLYQIERAKQDLRSARSHWKLGTLSLNLHQFDRARDHFTKAVELEPSYQPAVNLRLSIVDELRSQEGSGSEGSETSPAQGSAERNTRSSTPDPSQSNPNNPFSNPGN
jgi:hypothetical protein